MNSQAWPSDAIKAANSGLGEQVSFFRDHIRALTEVVNSIANVASVGNPLVGQRGAVPTEGWSKSPAEESDWNSAG